ncbi:probable arginine--tRNA ligase, mitochondrial isoform X2 [Myxocyprinus asiaticus]|uniref:probable arginine--tRNA ligase, mitochondrial isoform X2 n=1 Tax=Myxocyprinus asiaticus TaxID=70543 RepID=UPI002221721E|nr:probable arginine--tRNA ligase, mitochondrial isoform X2 [Myxocyprinus asiaticus]
MQFGLLGAGFERFRSQVKLRARALQHLFKVHVQGNREAKCDESMRLAAAVFFRCLEQHEDQPLSLWKQFREITVEEYKRIYEMHCKSALVTSGLAANSLSDESLVCGPVWGISLSIYLVASAH